MNGTLNAISYLYDILNPIAIPIGLASVDPRLILQDDNARPHRARIVQEYHDQHLNYTHLKWPSYSPDLNPFEQAWDMLVRVMAEVHPQPKHFEDLAIELQIQ
jgi:transposase